MKKKSKESTIVTSSKPARQRKAWKVLLLSVVAFAIIFSVVSLLVTKSVFDANFGRVNPPQYTMSLRYADVAGYERTQVGFPSGKNNLIGYVYGEENGKGLVVLAHGLGGGAESNTALTIALVDNGWRVFAYDCTGSYSSEGNGTEGLPQSALDLDAALNYAESQNWDLPIMLYGHSWGGYAVAAVLDMGHDISAAISVAGYASPDALLREQMQDMMGEFSTVAYPFGWFYQRMLFGEDAQWSAIDAINNSSVPIMIIHGAEDEMIRYDGAGIIAHRGEITNPNAVYVTRNAVGQNGHNNLLGSLAAARYVEEKKAEYEIIQETYGGEIPDDVRAGYYANIDKFLASELDVDLLGEMIAFYEAHL
ncbi:alpha/beta hydrolase [Christensenellaceae bacterium OttesenSCG-928-M15]|nr:alpha/beta hydrolase [Christensenellaceae bacterium OttesenSCG-928-M15]